MASQVINIFNFLGSVLYAISNEMGWSQKRALVIGQGSMCFLLIMIIVFTKLEENIWMLSMLAIFLLVSQMTSGPIKTIHCYETCVDSAAGIAHLFFFFVNPSGAVITEYLINTVGISGMFTFFASVSGIGFIYYCIFFKDTCYKYVIENEVTLRIRLTDKEK